MLLVPGVEDTWSFQDMELWESRAVGTMGRDADARCCGDTWSQVLRTVGFWAVSTREQDALALWR